MYESVYRVCVDESVCVYMNLCIVCIHECIDECV